MHKKTEKFIGFPAVMRKNFWMYPRLLDTYWNLLGGSEQKVLDFILRRTWGFEKLSDRISLSQFSRGGGKIGNGTGLSQRQIITAVKKLKKKGFIQVKKQKGETNEYSLVVQKIHQTGEKSVPSTGALNASTTGEEISYTIDNSIDTTIERVYECFKRLVLPTARMSTNDKKKIERALKEFHTREIGRAIENFGESDWHMKNSTKTIGWFFDSNDRIDKFLSLNPLPYDDVAYKSKKDKSNDKELPTQK